jgi:hypothetical protein
LKHRHEPVAKFYTTNWRTGFFFLGNSILHIINMSRRSSWKMTAAHCAGIEPQHWLIEHMT